MTVMHSVTKVLGRSAAPAPIPTTAATRAPAPIVLADASETWRTDGPAGAARPPTTVPAPTAPDVASSVKVLNLAGTTLEPGRPLVLEGLDPNRAIAYIEAESLSGRPVQVSV